MTHDMARHLASLAHDRELDAVRVGDLAAHLAECADCASFAGQLSELPVLTAALPRITPRAELADETVALLPRAQRRRSSRRWLVPVAVAAAAAAALVVVVPSRRTPFAVLPAAAAAAPLVQVRSLYLERSVVETPDGDPARRRTIAEKVWWVAPDRLRVERTITDTTGRTVGELTIRAGDAGFDATGGQPGVSYRGAPPDLGAIPEPLSPTVAVLGRPTGPGPVVEGRPTTRYELRVQGARRIALVDPTRYVALGGEDRLVVSKQQLVDGVVVATRTVTHVHVNAPVDDATFRIPRGTGVSDRGFRSRDVGSLGDVAPRARPRGFSIVAAGVDGRGTATVLYQNGAFPVLVQANAPTAGDDFTEVNAATVGGESAVVRVPLYGYPSVSFAHGRAQVTVTAPLQPRQLVEFVEQMYFPAE